MLNTKDILETISMIQDENLDIRTVTMGISLLDCIDSDIDKACDKVYDKITRYAKSIAGFFMFFRSRLNFPDKIPAAHQAASGAQAHIPDYDQRPAP